MLTVGEILKKEREKKGYSLSHIEKKIRVRESFLKAIEANNWSTFSSKIYITGIIKNYARFLGIDPGRALAFFRRDYGRKEDISFKKAASSKHLVPESRQYAIAGLTFLILIFFTYFAFQLNLFLSPPKVTLLSPKTSQFKKQNRVKIVGKTEKEAVVTIFKDRVLTASFSDQLLVNMEVHMQNMLTTDQLEKLIDEIKEHVRREVPSIQHVQVELEAPE